MNGATFAFVALAATALVWLAVGNALLVVFRARRPHEGPVTSDLRDQPPAVVNLLTHEWQVTASAAAATLLDLATRKYIEIVQVTPEQDVVELRRTGRDARDLQPYERQVLDHLRRKAVGGVVPAAALTTGPAAASDAWWRHFRRSVEKDARQRGLAQARFPSWVIAMFGLGLVVLAGWLVLDWSSTKDAAPDDGPRLWSVIAAIAIVGLCALVAKRFDRNRQRDTNAGLESASHWLGVRRGYTEGRYDELTPAAVILYERHLAYAAAMDAARRTVARLPLSAEDDRLAWSHHGDRWRQVEVRYPTWRVGWGEGPGRAMLGGLLWTATLAIPIYVWLRFGSDLRQNLEDAARSIGQVDDPGVRLYDDDVAYHIAVGVTWAIVVTLFAITVLAARRGLIRLARGLLDAGREEVMRGTVVRRRTWPRQRGTESDEVHWIAVDDGTGERIQAFVARPGLATLVRQDDEVELGVTPFLGFVRAARVTANAPELPAPQPIDQLPGPTPLPPVHWIERYTAANAHPGNGNGHAPTRPHASYPPLRLSTRVRTMWRAVRRSEPH
jgi:Predicted membrane protein (DUF2207)